jgi:hypothetical protein
MRGSVLRLKTARTRAVLPGNANVAIPIGRDQSKIVQPSFNFPVGVQSARSTKQQVIKQPRIQTKDLKGFVGQSRSSTSQLSSSLLGPWDVRGMGQ